MSHVPQQVGLKIQRLRIARNLTQEAVAELLDAAPTTVSRWETGVTMPSIRYQKRLCEILRVEYKELFGNMQMTQPAQQQDHPHALHAPETVWFEPATNQAQQPQPLVELQIAIPVAVLSAKELIQQITQNVTVNGKKQAQVLQIEQPVQKDGHITVTACLYHAGPPRISLNR